MYNAYPSQPLMCQKLGQRIWAPQSENDCSAIGPSIGSIICLGQRCVKKWALPNMLDGLRAHHRQIFSQTNMLTNFSSQVSTKTSKRLAGCRPIHHNPSNSASPVPPNTIPGRSRLLPAIAVAVVAGGTNGFSFRKARGTGDAGDAGSSRQVWAT